MGILVKLYKILGLYLIVCRAMDDDISTNIKQWSVIEYLFKSEETLATNSEVS